MTRRAVSRILALNSRSDAAVASPVMAVIVLPWHTWAEKTGLLGCAAPRRSTTRLPAYRASGRSESRRDALVRCDLDDIRPADRAEGSAPRAGVARREAHFRREKAHFLVVATLGWADPVVGTRGMTTRPPRVSHPHTRIAPGRRRCSRLHA
jgi:hypothetical protein